MENINKNHLLIATATVLSIVGRKYLTLNLPGNAAHKPLFQLLVLFSVMFINTRQFMISLAVAVGIYLLSQTNVFLHENFCIHCGQKLKD